MKRRRHVYRRHTMSAMELRVAKRDHMSAVANLGRRTTLRRSSSSLDRRSTIRRHGTMTSVSGMNHTPKSTTSISLSGLSAHCRWLCKGLRFSLSG